MAKYGEMTPVCECILESVQTRDYQPLDIADYRQRYIGQQGRLYILHLEKYSELCFKFTSSYIETIDTEDDEEDAFKPKIIHEMNDYIATAPITKIKGSKEEIVAKTVSGVYTFGEILCCPWDGNLSGDKLSLKIMANLMRPRQRQKIKETGDISSMLEKEENEEEN